MDNTELISTILNALNVGALGVIVYFFIKGQIISKPTLDALLNAIEGVTNKMANEINENIESAVENGVLKAYSKLDDKKASGD